MKTNQNNLNTKNLNSILSEFQNHEEKVVIELGPGEVKACHNSIGIDIVKKESVDYIADLEQGLPFINDSSIDLIYAFHFLEHVKDIEFMISEIFRVLKAGGRLIATVPHFSNPYFYSDYTHFAAWGLYSFSYFSNKQFFKRGVPTYYNKLDFNIKKINLIFNSPHLPLYYLKRLTQKIVNSSRLFQELYEENFVYIFPCYEIKVELEKIESNLKTLI
jgi:ubiquinone/menaquinone biosynthesis C-methylase UbiE